MNKKKIIYTILLICIIFSAVNLFREHYRNMKDQKKYEELASSIAETTVEESTEETEPETQPYVSPVDFESLLEKNSDTIGWIKIPDTNIDYPIVQANDNEKYLHTDFDGKDSVLGTIYLDVDSNSDLYGLNNIIYGHNMKNGSMFKDIVRFKDKDYFKSHQYFEIYTPKRTIHLKAVSCYYGEADPMARKTRFKTRESYDAYVQKMLSPCSYAEIPDVPIDRLYTLITCSYELKNARTFLYAVEVDEDGNIVEADRENPVLPDVTEVQETNQQQKTTE